MAGRGIALAVVLIATLSAALLATLAHAGPLDGTPACSAATLATRAAQNDFGLYRDASDNAAAPDALTPSGNTYYWGWLDAGAARPGADLHDIVTIALTGAGETTMANITVNWEDAAAAPAPVFALDIFAPGAATPTFSTTSAGGTVTWTDDIAGAWRFDAHTMQLADVGACAGPDLGAHPAPTSADQNYGVYFGCNPFCVTTSPRTGA